MWTNNVNAIHFVKGTHQTIEPVTSFSLVYDPDVVPPPQLLFPLLGKYLNYTNTHTMHHRGALPIITIFDLSFLGWLPAPHGLTRVLDLLRTTTRKYCWPIWINWCCLNDELQNGIRPKPNPQYAREIYSIFRFEVPLLQYNGWYNDIMTGNCGWTFIYDVEMIRDQFVNIIGIRTYAT